MGDDYNFGDKTRSILGEISKNYLPSKNKHELVEVRAERIIMSAINLLEMIESNYSKEEYEELEKRLVMSVRQRDPKKFSKSIIRMKEPK